MKNIKLFEDFVNEALVETDKSLIAAAKLLKFPSGQARVSGSNFIRWNKRGGHKRIDYHKYDHVNKFRANIIKKIKEAGLEHKKLRYLKI